MKAQNDGERLLRAEIRKEVRGNKREGIKRYVTRIFSLDILIFYVYHFVLFF